MDDFSFGVQVVSHDLRYLYLNKILLSEINMQEVQLLNKRMSDVFPGIENSDIYKAIEKTIASKSSEKVINEFTLPNGNTTYYELDLQPIPQGAIIFSKDITDSSKSKIFLEKTNERLESEIKTRVIELEELNQKLVEESKRAIESGRSKSEFLANMSHEIRTPLNGVVGMAELLSITDLSNEQREYVRGMRLSSDLLLSIINDILDFSKLDSGKVNLYDESIDIRDCISDCLKLFEFKLADKKIEVIQYISKNVPGLIIADEKRIKQIIINLIGNATKFTSANGVIKITLKTTLRNNIEHLQFSIRDNGIGINESKQNILFQAFVQADSSITKKFEGTGLGLAISGKIVDLMKGRIWFKSKENIGSTFFFEIPLKASEKQNLEYLNSESFNFTNTECVVIDNNRINLKVFQDMLNLWQIKTKTYLDPFQGIEEVKKKKPDFVIVDFFMPEMSGIEVATILKEKYNSNLKVILATSAEYQNIHQQRNLFDKIITKPVRMKSLYESIYEILNTVSNKNDIITNEFQQLKNSYKALIVEDNLLNRQFAEKILKKFNIKTTTAENGLIGFELASKEKFDFILMDIHMPVMDGLECSRLIQEKIENPPPIIIMSADVYKITENLNFKTEAFILKPVRISDLNEIFDKLQFT
ncbi:response regulator [Leptospira levettii]|uniref:Sensory/regulatory protein RpfC n=1 Tax=Leptospira levettii TaxID=2023178 RepID=A0AAW5V408_9LEPT|nr:response regulator [Leptospira levettii]MCW7466088.1 response regulator [Leptospira levettii]MCW7512387.1 response regulator [Leptospira levettii]MCW7516395.1 response regulator [Leptospira levettii]